MASEYALKRNASGEWEYPASSDVLEEVGLHSIRHYIDVRRATIAKWVAGRPILKKCKEGARRRGSTPHLYWWEQSMSLDKPVVSAGEDDGDEGSW